MATIKPSGLVRERLKLSRNSESPSVVEMGSIKLSKSHSKTPADTHSCLSGLRNRFFSPPSPLFPTLSCEAASLVAAGRAGGRTLTAGYTGEAESNQSPPASDGPSVLVLGVLGGGEREASMHRKVIHLRASMNHRRW